MKKFFLLFFVPLLGLSQSLTLTWTDNSNNETGFGIERSTDGSTFAQIATVATDITTYQDTAISYNTTYWYRVYAYNSVGNSGYTNTASGLSELPTGEPPTPPQNLIYTIGPISAVFPIMQGLEWEAEAGQIDPPFIVSNGLVYQPQLTSDPANGGLAGYSFFIPQAGTYRIIFMVDALDGGSDSFFVQVDAEPTVNDVFHIVPLTQGIEARYVSSGPPSGPTVPRDFVLSAGYHDLYIRGREGSTELDYIYITVP